MPGESNRGKFKAAAKAVATSRGLVQRWIVVAAAFAAALSCRDLVPRAPPRAEPGARLRGAPSRAEAPSLVAAPPASSDRLIRPEELHESVVRTVPVRVDIEQSAGKVFISVNPLEATVRPAEGIEWDFRYLGGADVTVDEIQIEFDRPSPFGTLTYKSRKPGAARPHRQMSSGVTSSSAGKRVQYTIRALTGFKSELANTHVFLNIVA